MRRRSLRARFAGLHALECHTREIWLLVAGSVLCRAAGDSFQHQDHKVVGTAALAHDDDWRSLLVKAAEPYTRSVLQQDIPCPACETPRLVCCVFVCVVVFFL